MCTTKCVTARLGRGGSYHDQQGRDLLGRGMTTVGYGDITPVNRAERTYATFTVLWAP